jgi:uncharacterized membrane-anchored protein
MNQTNNTIFNKVANLTIAFWVIKIISTTAGEASADFLRSIFGNSAVIMVGVALITCLIIQLSFKKYTPWMYWTVILFVAIFGTMFSDVVHHLGIPIGWETALFIGLLFIMLGIWYASEKTLDVHHVKTLRRELLYWSVIFLTFTFGTAAGDMVAHGLNLGFAKTTLMFGACMIIIPLVLYAFKINKIALFWITYILTRPFGASGADWLGKSTHSGGLGLGDGTTAVIALTFMLVFIVYLSLTHKDEMLIEERINNA